MKQLFWGAMLALIVTAGIMGVTAVTLTQKEYTPVTVRVCTGDTVWSIAGKHVSGEEDVRELVYRIKEANNLKDYTVQPGQTIIVPVDK